MMVEDKPWNLEEDNHPLLVEDNLLLLALVDINLVEVDIHQLLVVDNLFPVVGILDIDLVVEVDILGMDNLLLQIVDMDFFFSNN
jgi:hypothetical protein